LGFPGAETPKHQNLFTLYHFGVSHIEISQLANTRKLTLGIPGCRNAKHQNLFMLYHFGVSHIRISQLANTRKLTLGIPGCRNAKTSKSIHSLSFRGFLYRDFATGEYKEIDPWDSRMPKCRNIKIYSCSIISGFLILGFRNWRIQGN
jgi:hypothetical protein